MPLPKFSQRKNEIMILISHFAQVSIVSQGLELVLIILLISLVHSSRKKKLYPARYSRFQDLRSEYFFLLEIVTGQEDFPTMKKEPNDIHDEWLVFSTKDTI